jgi:membrane protein YdbS with pleckstrin-like domain
MKEFFAQNQWVIWLIVAWVLPWKGVALWKAARLRDKWWFIAILVINTLAVLEILYIFIFSKRKLKEREVKVDNYLK